MGNIRFINQKSNCELGGDLHMTTCWPDANQDFIFPSRKLKDLIS